MKDAKIIQFTGEPSYFKQATTTLKKLTDAESELKRAQVKVDQALQTAQSKLRPLIAQAKRDNRYDQLKSKLTDELTASNNTSTRLQDLGFDHKGAKMNTLKQQMNYHARQYHALRRLLVADAAGNRDAEYDALVKEFYGIGQTRKPKDIPKVKALAKKMEAFVRKYPQDSGDISYKLKSLKGHLEWLQSIVGTARETEKKFAPLVTKLRGEIKQYNTWLKQITPEAKKALQGGDDKTFKRLQNQASKKHREIMKQIRTMPNLWHVANKLYTSVYDPHLK